MTATDTYIGVRLAAAEGLASGITTVHDWAHNVLTAEHADANLRAHRELGTRVHWSYGVPSAHPSLSREEMRRILGPAGKQLDEPMGLDDVARIRREWMPGADGLLSIGVNVRGPARSSPEVYRHEWEAARRLELPIAMHCSGTRAEAAQIQQVTVLAEERLLGEDLLLAHCLYLSEKERRQVADCGVRISMSPTAELRLAMGFPPLIDHLSAGVVVSLSLDTPAIAGSADPFQSMRLILGLANTDRGDATAITPRDVLRIATLEGARALDLDHVTGSITPGKRADVVLLRTDQMNMAPVVDPGVAVVHSGQPANVDTVLVDGRIVKRNGELTAVEPGEIANDADKALRSLCSRAGLELPSRWNQPRTAT